MIVYGRARLEARIADARSVATLRAESLARIAAEQRQRRAKERERRRAAWRAEWRQRREQALLVVRRPYLVARGDPRCPKLERIKLWQCPLCPRRWHWPRRPMACGFCAKEE